MEAAGLRHDATLGIEGPGCLLTDLEARWADPARREQLLAAARWLEAEPSLLGLSAHLLVAARRPAGLSVERLASEAAGVPGARWWRRGRGAVIRDA